MKKLDFYWYGEDNLKVDCSGVVIKNGETFCPEDLYAFQKIINGKIPFKYLFYKWFKRL